MTALGLAELVYEVDNYNNVFLNSTRLSDNIIETIDIMIENEKKENNEKETIEMLTKSKKNYEWILDVTDDYAEYLIEIYNQKIYIEEDNNYITTRNLDDDEIEERLTKMEKRTKDKEIMKQLKEIRLKLMFSSTVNGDKIDEILDDVLKEERKKFDAFTTYLNNEIEKMADMIKKTFSYIGSYEQIADYLKESDDVKFDEEGNVTFD